jgi:acyl-CoA dehydrogenase
VQILWVVIPIILFGVLAYYRANIYIWTIAYGAYYILLSVFSSLSLTSLIILWFLYIVMVVLFDIKPLRQALISKHIFNIFQRSLPTLSVTEKQALAAGTVGWDADLFSGIPDWNKCLSYPPAIMSEEERLFLNGPVSKLCAMINNWDITHNRFNLPKKIWDFLKEQGFFGIIIPKEYGGKGFSAYAHSAILTKIAGRSMSVASVVAVPNSLGPAELLLHYGTSEQQNCYLPRLAAGIEIPCFALTSEEAGSDASAMPDYGIVCKGVYETDEMIGIKLNWNKRYITLAPVATVLGLAFKLYDPDHLIGTQEYLGITCALIPTHLPGITIGRRHYPLNCAFPNGPTQGKNVFIPIDWIIGGSKMAGHGWRMLVECLATGRAISLPSMSSGGAKVTAYATGAYARIREQFRLPIGKFGGIEEALSRIAGYVYIMDATRVFTVCAIDRGEKPSVPAAISKYHITELGRKAINDAMDIHGGKGICMGPKNYLANTYQETPISITVEGANILTRSMIIFGQGAIRCHPYILREINAVLETDTQAAIKKFDHLIFAHCGFMLSNAVRTFILGITNAKWSRAPRRKLRRYYQQLTRMSSALAFVSDVYMMLLGGALKRKEKLSGRLGDVLSMLYLGSAVLKYFEDNGAKDEEITVAQWASQILLYTSQKQLYEAIINFPNRIISFFLRLFVFPLGNTIKKPSDKLGHELSRMMLNADGLRSLLAKDAYLDPDGNNPIGYIEEVLKKTIAVESIENEIHKAVRDKKISGYNYELKIKNAVTENIITSREAEQVLDAYNARRKILAVDDFSPEELENLHFAPSLHRPKEKRLI